MIEVGRSCSSSVARYPDICTARSCTAPDVLNEREFRNRKNDSCRSTKTRRVCRLGQMVSPLLNSSCVRPCQIGELISWSLPRSNSSIVGNTRRQSMNDSWIRFDESFQVNFRMAHEERDTMFSNEARVSFLSCHAATARETGISVMILTLRSPGSVKQSSRGLMW